ncbi:TetR/AcrR family transcriptional regulator [Heliorestis acidaminivorans]|uniref:TetR/AcrR family transcriptional regulator n=1 Tax=Heliorestis acidaminivorans TaxID=553427 RepID=A0A6I0EPC2_9FIRM|nr:TetR/AcrR family transcriptional regulator [Heliorestis acidaminivorans]KAB2951788.1 TetR/AcrR family transcriptional regulator [Heliorestis acidaminivorans]
MPKPTFFNLSEEKKANLLKAIKKEFSRAPYNEALISNIVKSASIARGSFYQYFEDKEDAFLFLLDEHIENNKAYFIHSLQKFNGDLFLTYIEMFHYMIMKFENQEDRAFFKNAFLNMNHKVESRFTRKFNDKDIKHFLEIKDMVRKDNLTITDEQELFHVMRILTAVTIHNLVETCAKELTIEESLKIYTKEIHLLKKGLVQEEVISSNDTNIHIN